MTFQKALQDKARSQSHSPIMCFMCDLLYKESPCFEEAVQNKEWVEAMTEEYQSIMKNDVWDGCDS